MASIACFALGSMASMLAAGLLTRLAANCPTDRCRPSTVAASRPRSTVRPWHFLDNHKKVQTFSWGGFAYPDPPFKSAAVAASARQVRTLEPSRPLSRPPWVGSTWSMVWNVDYRTARSSPTRPADSGTFFWAPLQNFFLQVFRRSSRKLLK